MNRSNRTYRSNQFLSPEVIKAALKQASISDLLDEAFFRGQPVEPQQEPAPDSGDDTVPDKRMPLSDAWADALAEKYFGQISPPIRGVWNALTNPMFLQDPLAAGAYDGFMRRLQAAIESGEEGILWAMTVLETATRVMENPILKREVLARYQQQQDFIKRYAANISAFARGRYALHGRGVVIIDWPLSEFSMADDIQAGIEYMTEEVWKEGGKPRPGENSPSLDEFEAGKHILQALGQYDPSCQAVVIFNDIEEKAADAYVPTFIFESLDING